MSLQCGNYFSGQWWYILCNRYMISITLQYQLMCMSGLKNLVELLKLLKDIVSQMKLHSITCKSNWSKSLRVSMFARCVTGTWEIMGNYNSVPGPHAFKSVYTRTRFNGSKWLLPPRVLCNQGFMRGFRANTFLVI